MLQALMPLALPSVFAVPLFWGLLSLFWREPAKAMLTGTGVLLQLFASIMLWQQVSTDGAFSYTFGGWSEPLGILLRVDGLAAAFVLLTTLIAGGCAMHAHLYLRDKINDQRYFWPILWFLWAGLNSVWLSADIFNLYVSLELVSLCAVGLVAMSGERQALSAALRYLLAALLGSLAYLLGVALIYGAYAALALPLLAEQIEPGVTVSVAIALMVTGLLFKTALFPLHGWLPPAHSQAPAPVSALLSALVIKGSFYVIFRLWTDLGHVFPGRTMASFLGVLATLAIFWGSWKALRQQSLKMLVAYSTVAQVGYFFLLFPLLYQQEVGAALAREGTMLLLASHALAKAGMFLAAGNLITVIGGDRIAGLRGISRFNPISLFAFALAGLTLAGMPPSGGFTAKWLMLQSALAGEYWHWLIVLILGSLATAAYVFKVLQVSFRAGPREDIFNHPPRLLELAPMVLASASVLLGLVSAEPLRMLSLVMGEASP